MTHEPDFTNLFFCRKLEEHKYFHIQGKNVCIKWVGFLSKPTKTSFWGHFLDFLGIPDPIRLCFKIQTITFPTLLLPNFMQKK